MARWRLFGAPNCAPGSRVERGKRRKAPSRRQRVGAGGHLAVVVWIALGLGAILTGAKLQKKRTGSRAGGRQPRVRDGVGDFRHRPNRSRRRVACNAVSGLVQRCPALPESSEIAPAAGNDVTRDSQGPAFHPSHCEASELAPAEGRAAVVALAFWYEVIHEGGEETAIAQAQTVDLGRERLADGRAW